MKNKYFIRIAAIVMAIIMAATPISVSAASILKRGSSGNEVKRVQATLMELGYYTYPKTTGYYGAITESAVKRFQKDYGIKTDGVFGTKTRNALQEDTTKIAVTSYSVSKVSTTSYLKKAGALDWFGKVNGIWERGMDAVVTDIDTGKSFQLRRTYGTNHADVESLTREDTKIIKEIWGGFSWERRAVVVQVGEYTLAGAMSAMPHAGVDSAPAAAYVSGRSGGYGRGKNLDAVKNNGISGVMDLHFKNSRTHSTNTKQKSMQDMVNKAAEYIRTSYIN